jgi:histidinol-phosphate phosphatase family protein
MLKGRQGKRGAIFLDRDGVINACPAGRYVTKWQEFRFLPGVLDALWDLRCHRQIVIVASNQSGVGRGVMTAGQLAVLTRQMLKAIREAGGRVHAVYTCPHHPEAGCLCRKPRPGLLFQAARRFAIDLKRSFVVGDDGTDILMGKSVGCRTVLVLSGRQSRVTAKRLPVAPDRIAADLPRAVRWILQEKRLGVSG